MDVREGFDPAGAVLPIRRREERSGQELRESRTRVWTQLHLRGVLAGFLRLSAASGFPLGGRLSWGAESIKSLRRCRPAFSVDAIVGQLAGYGGVKIALLLCVGPKC